MKYEKSSSGAIQPLKDQSTVDLTDVEVIRDPRVDGVWGVKLKHADEDEGFAIVHIFGEDFEVGKLL